MDPEWDQKVTPKWILNGTKKGSQMEAKILSKRLQNTSQSYTEKSMQNLCQNYLKMEPESFPKHMKKHT